MPNNFNWEDDTASAPAPATASTLSASTAAPFSWENDVAPAAAPAGPQPIAEGAANSAGMGVNDALAATAGAPVDATAWLLRKLGAPVSDAPLLGSKFDRRLFNAPTNLIHGNPLSTEHVADPANPLAQATYAGGYGTGTALSALALGPLADAAGADAASAYLPRAASTGQVVKAAGLGAASGEGALVGGSAGESIDKSLGGSGKTGQTIGSIAGGLLVPGVAVAATRRLAGPLQAFTESGREMTTGEYLNRLAAGADTSADTTAELPGVNLSVGQRTGNRGLLGGQRLSAMENTTNGAEADVARANNNDALFGHINSLAPGEVANSTDAANNASETLSDRLDQLRGSARANEKTAWNNIGNADFSTRGLRGDLKGKIAELPTAQADYAPAYLGKTMDAMAQAGGASPISELTGLRSQLLDDARTATSAGQANRARWLNGTADTVLQHLSNPDNIASGDPGVIGRYNDARAVSSEYNQVFNRGVTAKVFGTTATGANRVEPTATAGQFITSGAGAPEKLDSLLDMAGKDPAAMGAARNYFAAKLKDAATGPYDSAGNATVSSKGVGDFLNDNQDAMMRLNFTPEQRQLVQAIRSNAMANDAPARARLPGGSDTAANIASQRFIDGLAGKWVGQSYPAKVLGNVAGKFLFEPAQKQINALIFKALAPDGADLARELMRKASAGNLKMSPNMLAVLGARTPEIASSARDQLNRRDNSLQPASATP